MGDIEDSTYRQVSAKIISKAVLDCIRGAGGDAGRLADLALIITDNAAVACAAAQNANASVKGNSNNAS